MKGIIGAARVVGCPQHGVGICDVRSTGSSLLMELKAGSLAPSRDDANFLAAFRLSATVKTGEFPPAALVELYHEPEAIAARLRRLHLVIVDLCQPQKTATRTEKHFCQQIAGLQNEKSDSVTPIPLCNQEEWMCRYVFGYSLDDSDKPVYLIWRGLEAMASGSSMWPGISSTTTFVFFFPSIAAWLCVSIVRAVALLSALTK